MNFLGMGYLEIIIILLIAFILLGPERMVDAARLLGRAVGEVRRMAADLPSLDLDEPLFDPIVVETDDSPVAGTPDTAHSARDPNPKETLASDPSPDAEDGSSQADGPVAFRPSTQEDSVEEKPEARA